LDRWRRVRVGCADFDWRILFQASLKLPDDLRHRIGNPSVVRAHVALLFPVGKLWGAGVVVFPVVLIYTCVVYWIFRGKVGKVARGY
jgi:hypothetical protein